jgi:hypothetical protein
MNKYKYIADLIMEDQHNLARNTMVANNFTIEDMGKVAKELSEYNFPWINELVEKIVRDLQEVK